MLSLMFDGGGVMHGVFFPSMFQQVQRGRTGPVEARKNETNPGDLNVSLFRNFKKDHFSVPTKKIDDHGGGVGNIKNKEREESYRLFEKAFSPRHLRPCHCVCVCVCVCDSSTRILLVLLSFFFFHQKTTNKNKIKVYRRHG
jgi:hypothetical protein